MNNKDFSDTLNGFTQLMSVMLAFPGAKNVIQLMLKTEYDMAVALERKRILKEAEAVGLSNDNEDYILLDTLEDIINDKR